MKKTIIILSTVLSASLLLCACSADKQEVETVNSQSGIISEKVNEVAEYTADSIKSAVQSTVDDVLKKAYTVEGTSESQEEEPEEEADAVSESDATEASQPNIIDYEGVKSTFQSVLELGDEEAGISLKSAKAAYEVLRMANEMGISELDSDVAANIIDSCLNAFSSGDKKEITQKLAGLKRVGEEFFAGDEMAIGYASDAGVGTELESEMNNEFARDNWDALFAGIDTISQN